MAETPTPAQVVDLRLERLRQVVFLVYVLAVAGLVILHEPWRDEADAWLVARDASLPELFALTGHMGTPALWYLLLAPLAKLGVPYVAMNILNGALAAGAVALVLWRAPVSLPTATLLAFSYPLLFEYAVVARGYALTCLLLFLAAAFWSCRFERPWLVVLTLGLMAQVNVHGLLFAGVLGAIWLVESLRVERLREVTLPLATLLLAGLATVAQLIATGPSQLATWVVLKTPPYVYLATFWGLPFVPLDSGLPLGGPTAVVFVLLVAQVLAVVALVGSTANFVMARQWQAAAFTVLSWAGLHYVFVYKWFGGPRHACLLLVVVVVARWLANGPSRPDNADLEVVRWRLLPRVTAIALHSGLVLSAISALGMARFDVRQQYSHGRQFAHFLQDNNLLDHDIASTFWAESALPYLERPTFWYAELAREASHNSWDATYEAGSMLSVDERAAVVNGHFRDRSRLLFVAHRPLSDAAAAGFDLLWVSQGSVGPSAERFWVYRAVPLPTTPQPVVP